MTDVAGDAVPALIWCPFPDRESAAHSIECLLDETLIACANIFPEVFSAFEWDGERSEAREAGVLLKTNSAMLERAIARLAQLHPYDEPAILGWRCDAATQGTASWLAGLGR